jgi:hypothetical protein
VEPRGIEPLTSAVQKVSFEVSSVFPGVSKLPYLSLFLIVYRCSPR